jgi:L-erythro-3,5-diaminohexanoate dehydrogenase
VRELTGGSLADWLINCANVPETEIASILASKPSGSVLFFNMTTDFQRAVLGAEGIGRETRRIMGNGYVPGNADLALDLVRTLPELRGWFAIRQK